MAVRRLASEQPASFQFTPENLAWAKAKITDYPEGRQASAVIPILWKAQEQHDGWLPEPAIRLVADMLEMPYIRVFEIATFYTMFQLQPVGKTAHVNVCGTTPCMLRGSDEIIRICKSRIAAHAHELSSDGRFSWEEVECAGACVNAPMVQIGSDTYEDLTADTFNALLDAFERGETPAPGPQSGRRSSEPITGATTLLGGEKERVKARAAEAPGDAAPDSDVSPTSPAAAEEHAGRPSGSDRAEVEATRAGGDGKSVETVSPDEAKPDAAAANRAAPGAEYAAKAPNGQDDTAKASDPEHATPPGEAPAEAAATSEAPAPEATKAPDATETAEATAPAGKAPAAETAPAEAPAADAAEPEAPKAAEAAEAPKAVETPKAAETTPAPEAAAEAPAPVADAPKEVPATPAAETAPAAPAAEEAAPPRGPAPPDKAAARRADKAGTRPVGYEREAVETVDDLKAISGVGPVIEKTLHKLGIFTYTQIAAWDQSNKDWVNAYLAFKGRIDRERWVEQAQTFVEDKSGEAH